MSPVTNERRLTESPVDRSVRSMLDTSSLISMGSATAVGYYGQPLRMVLPPDDVAAVSALGRGSCAVHWTACFRCVSPFPL